MKPNYDPRMEMTTSNGTQGKTNKKSPKSATSQVWHKSESCPKGTIPIRRTRRKDVLGANPRDSHGRKKPSMHVDFNNSSLLVQANHWMDTVTQEPKQSFSLRTGPYYDYDCVESEWAVNPGVYGDRQTRFFVNWTADASRNTGCFDLTCPGFVQTNHEIALGSAISSISTPNGVPYEIVVYIFKDPLTNNWWVQLGGKVLGYFPPELFDSLKYQAVVVQWGGEVYSSKVGVHPHTATAMSSGEYANWLARNSGYIRNMRISENSQELKFPEAVSSHTDEYDCYDFYYLNDEDYVDDPEFYFGGPGRNERCP